mmetsp:Transcript_585/g.1867  ORF Transcript_585/g.1867 Transcript_585/m.1867 type:complete len:200 (-) Transcript_585:18-617(-)
MCVAMRSRKKRSWLTTKTQPAKSSSASSRLRIVLTSRSLVGSSSSSTLPPDLSTLASCTRLRSPPDSLESGFCCAWPVKPNHEQYARELTSCVPRVIVSSPAESSSKTELSPCSDWRDWSTQIILTLSPTTSSPSSGACSPVSMRTRVVLPAPFGPTTPTMPPGGREKVRPSMSVLSPKPLRTPLASTTCLPRRGPGGM